MVQNQLICHCCCCSDRDYHLFRTCLTPACVLVSCCWMRLLSSTKPPWLLFIFFFGLDVSGKVITMLKKYMKTENKEQRFSNDSTINTQRVYLHTLVCLISHICVDKCRSPIRNKADTPHVEAARCCFVHLKSCQS